MTAMEELGVRRDNRNGCIEGLSQNVSIVYTYKDRTVAEQMWDTYRDGKRASRSESLLQRFV
jgi:hypothetical protein